MNYYQFHIGDYACATRHLSWLEDAAYRRLLDLYYLREGPLPIDERAIYRLAVASSEEERMAVDMVLAEFFVLNETGWSHKRCDTEITVMQDKKAKASQSAQTRWSNAKKKDDALPLESNSNAVAMRTHANEDANASKTSCESNAPNTNTNTNRTTTTAREPVGFAEFWLAYPRKVGKGAAESAWKKLRPSLEACLKAIEQAKSSPQWQKDGGQFVPHPATWLNQRRWEDSPSPEPAKVREVPHYLRGAI